MRNKILLLIFLCCYMQGRSQTELCGFDKVHQQLMSKDAGYTHTVNDFNAKWQKWMATKSDPNALVVVQPNGDTVYEIPVVVHIVHTGDTIGSKFNPADSVITKTIDFINQCMAATTSVYFDTANGGTAFPVKFVLAKRTPDCKSTSGITRIDGSVLPGYVTSGVLLSGSAGAADADIKALSIWPNTEYYNIWVINKVDGYDGITGGPATVAYAYFPGAPSNIDGAMVMALFMKPGNHVLAHELGHAFSLYHTFQGSTLPAGCPVNNSCATDGDQVCDTEPHYDQKANACPTFNACTNALYGKNTRYNFMNYSNCTNHLFTPNQRERYMFSLINERASLLTSLGTTPPAAISLPVTCVPTYAHPTAPQNAGPQDILISNSAQTTVLFSTSSGGYIGDGNTVYMDRTCGQQIKLHAGDIYNIAVNTLSQEKARAYIDYNNNGVFEQKEIIMDDGIGQSHSANFGVPQSGVDTHLLRMRVISDIVAGNIDSCGSLQYGQAEDYAVLIDGVVNSVNTIATKENIQLYPNPNDGNFILKAPSTGKAATIEILNIMGQIVHKQEAAPVNGLLLERINFTGIPKGVYLLQLSDENNSTTIRFNVQ